MTVASLIELLQQCDPNKQVQLNLNVEGECPRCSTHVYSTGLEPADRVREEINRVVIYGS